MDHSFGESQNYHRPIEQELLEDYLNAVDLLTINEENRLKIKVQKLEGETNEIQELKTKVDKSMLVMDKLAEVLGSVYDIGDTTIIHNSKEDVEMRKLISELTKKVKAKSIKLNQEFA